MNHLKARLLALFVIIVFAGLTYFGWRQLMTEGKYSPKLAAPLRGEIKPRFSVRSSLLGCFKLVRKSSNE